MARKKDFNYFDALTKSVEYSYSAAKLLDDTLRNFNKESMQKTIKTMHDIEHTADLEGYEITKRLTYEFITPVEREDILLLIHKIDNITDYIEEVLLNIYMCNVRVIKEDAIKFSELILIICKELIEILKEFKNFRKSKVIQSRIIKVIKLEEEGDNLYTNNIRKLHLTSMNAIDIIAWTMVYKSLKKCCDACEETARTIEIVIMKNL